MVKKFSMLLLGLGCLACAFAQSKKTTDETLAREEWKDPEVFEQNKLYPRANVVAYGNENGIEKWGYAESPYRVSVNGEWRCKVVTSVAQKPNPEEKGFSYDGWPIQDIPMGQINKDGKPVEVPTLDKLGVVPSSKNPIATYCRTFEIPKSWSGYEVYLQMQAKSAYYVWVNQQYVGYSEDSRAYSEFNLTKHLKVGKPNTIAIQVMGMSDGGVMEMAPVREMCGITDSMFLLLKAPVNVQDYGITARYEPATGFGYFSVATNIRNIYKKGQYYVEVEVWNPNGKVLDKMGRWVVFDKKIEAPVTLRREFGGVKPWTAENPQLYTCVIRLRNERMELLETVGTRFGFRSVEVRNGVLTLNGKNITLRGVEYTGFDFQNNRIKNDQEMQQDLLLMKKNNINAIRTTTYSPFGPRFYEMCDELGFYVVCDANISPFSQGTRTVVSDKEYIPLFIVRAQNLYETYKNHTSIIAWSLGGSAQNGVGMENAYRTLKQKDSTRVVLYSGAEFSENTDVIATINPSMADLNAYGMKSQSRPWIFGTYGSVAGNGFGGMEAFWSGVRKQRQIQGGFVHQWNTSLSCVNKNNEVAWGFLDARNMPVPALEELRNIYRPFDVKMIGVVKGQAEFSVENLLDFSSLNNFVLEYSIFTTSQSGIVVGEISLDLPAGDMKHFKLRVPPLSLQSGEEAFISFAVKPRSKSKVFKPTEELCYFQFPIPVEKPSKKAFGGQPRLPLTVAMDSVTNVLSVTNGNFVARYDMGRAVLSSLSVADKELLYQAPILNFSRALTDNDKQDKHGAALWNNFLPGQFDRYVMVASYRVIDDYTVGIDAMIRFTDKTGRPLFDLQQTWAILHTGDILLNSDVVVSDYVQAVPRMGYRLLLDKKLSHIRWYGTEREAYADRMLGLHTGLNAAHGDSIFHCYDRPQSAGNHLGTRWMVAEDDAVGLYVDMTDSLFNFSVYPYSERNLSSCESLRDLAAQSYRTLNLDYKMAGVGSALGGVDVAEPYQLKAKNYNFTLHLRPYEKAVESPETFFATAYPEVKSSVLPMPLIEKGRERFDAPMEIMLSSETEGAKIYYTTDGTEPTEKSALYTKPFSISASCVVSARCFKEGCTSSFVATQRFGFDYIVSATFAKKANTPYNYHQETILFDGETGTPADLQSGWLGFSGSDLDVTFLLAKEISLQDVELHFAHVPESWAFAPVEVLVSTSADGATFSQPARAEISYNPASEEMNSAQVVTIKVMVAQPNVRYVKVVAKGIGKIPAWHRAKGLKPWLMIDEVELNEEIK